MEIANVSPIFKEASSLQAENYRPVSVLPVFSKILEKFMYNQIHSYFVENKLLSPKQFVMFCYVKIYLPSVVYNFLTKAQ